MPAHRDSAKHALGVRHHDRDATTARRKRRHAQRRAAGIERILISHAVVVINIARAHEAGLAAKSGRGGVGELGETFAVRDCDWNDRTFHSAKENAWAIFHPQRNEARLVTLGFVLNESWPKFRAGDKRFEIAHHLAAVAHAESERVFTGEEGGELGARTFVEQDAFGPAFAGAKHVTITEPAARNDTAEIL